MYKTISYHLYMSINASHFTDCFNSTATHEGIELKAGQMYC
jgi:hypothetical protein